MQHNKQQQKARNDLVFFFFNWLSAFVIVLIFQSGVLHYIQNGRFSNGLGDRLEYWKVSRRYHQRTDGVIIGESLYGI